MQFNNPVFNKLVAINDVEKSKTRPDSDQDSAVISIHRDKNFELYNADAQGFTSGINDRGMLGATGFKIQDSHFANRVNIWKRMRTGESSPGKKGEVINSIFVPTVKDTTSLPDLTAYMLWSPDVTGTVLLNGRPPAQVYDWFKKDELIFRDHNKVLDNNFQVYYPAQHSSSVISLKNLDLSEYPPCNGLTNQQCWDQYGEALAGAVVPSTAYKDPRVYGWVNKI